jgi:hypothetical protein
MKRDFPSTQEEQTSHFEEPEKFSLLTEHRSPYTLLFAGTRT